MKISQRLISVIVYYFVVYLFATVLSRSKKTSWKHIFRVFTLVLTLFALLYIPLAGADLNRINEIMHYYSTISTSQLIDAISKSSTPLMIGIYRVFGTIEIRNLLPAVASLISYGYLLYTIYKVAEKKKWESRYLAKVFFFLMAGSQFLQLISDIRSQSAFMIIGSCIIQEEILGKKITKHLPIYIALSLIHNAAFIVFLIRIALSITKKNRNILFKVAAIAMMAISIVYLLYNPNNVTLGSTNKILEYTSGKNSYSFFWQYIISSISLVTQIILIISNRNKIKKSEFKEQYRCFIVFVVISLLFFYQYSIFLRFSDLSLYLSLPLIGYSLQESSKKNSYRKVLSIATIIIIMLSATRGDMSGYTFL